MSRSFDVLLIAGFLFVDALFFHDAFKTGEVITIPQYVTGILSILVILRSGWALSGARGIFSRGASV